MLTPLHYALSLDPLLEQRTFSGAVSIEVAVEGRHDRIVLDSSGLEIGETTVDGRPAAVEIAGDRLSIIPAAPLEGSRATVRVVFRGRMHDAGRGFFMSGVCAVTQLQPAYARMLFPCFDDPAHKTTFDVSVSASHSHTVVANAPLLRDEIEGDRHRMTFARSARIPTHLLGLAVGPFQTSALDADGLPLRLFSLRSDGAEQSVLEALRDFVHFYNVLLGVGYPWPKLDLVVVPEYEAAGIETTSVLYLRESAVFLDPEAHPRRRRQRTALLAHELAHQWFGSLVTPSSWEDLWLSEGFATWLSAKVTTQREGADDAAEVRAIRVAMAADSLPSSRPLRTPGLSADELHELFDEIAYWKGAAILRMLEAWLGERTFRNGITLYLTRHAGGHATSSDLWRALEEVAERPVEEVAKPFVDRPGVATLRFSRDAQTIRIDQRGAETRTIPVVMKVGLANGDVEARSLLLASESCEVQMPATVTWVFGNAGAAGYYRCSYDDVRAVPPSQLSGPEAVTLLSDAWDALWSGAEDVISYLRAVDSLRSHPDVPAVAGAHLSELEELLAGGARHDPFAQWISSRFPAEVRRPDGIIDTATLRDDQILTHYENLLTDPATRPAAWEQLKANWDDLHRKVVSFGGRGAIAALAVVSDRATRNDIAGFFAERATGGAKRTLRQTLERIDGRIRFRDREQLAFDAWLTRQLSPSVAADQALRQSHALLNLLATGFHGALVQRSWLEGFGLTPPEWMQPAGDLARAVAALEQRLVAVFAGLSRIDPPLLDLSARLQEDLLASSDLTARLLAAGPHSSMETARGLTAVLARQGAVFERLLRGAIAFTELFGDDDASRLLRVRLASTEDDRFRIRRLLDQVASGDVTDDVRRALWNECASLPSLQNSQAAELAAFGGATAANRPPPTGRDS